MRAAAAPARRAGRPDERESAARDGESMDARRLAVLLHLAESFVHAPDDLSASSSTLSAAPDVASATLYASLALALDESSVDARRLLAWCYLMGGAALLFPFAPSTLGDTATPSRTPTRSAALQAVHLLQHGPAQTFSDAGSARVYASACAVLGRYDEAQQALQYAQKRQAPQREPITLTSARDIRGSQIQTQLGAMAMKGGHYSAAAAHFHDARDKDPWNWAAWTALCDMGTSRCSRQPKRPPPTPRSRGRAPRPPPRRTSRRPRR